MKKLNLLKDPIPELLYRLVFPTVAGMFSMTIYNLTDTYFVSALGANELAAMGFTFPIVMIVGAVASGISVGTSSLLSRAKGANDTTRIQRIATDGLLLALVCVAIVSTIGLMTMNPLFTALGADSNTLPLVKDYMTIWYLGVVVLIIPRVSDANIRSMGDMWRPFSVMMVGAVTNLIMDPLLIQGYWIFPRMGISGAALATALSRLISASLTLYYMGRVHGLFYLHRRKFTEIVASWREILHLGIPSIPSMVLPQITRALMTFLVATTGGNNMVAALAASNRIESFPFIIINGVGVALVPLIGQNWGACQYERVLSIRKIIVRFAFAYGLIIFLTSFFWTSQALSIFSDDPEIIHYGALYLTFVLFSLPLLSLQGWMSRLFTTIGKPRFTLLIDVAGTGFIIIPLLFLGHFLYDYIGMLAGLCLGQIILGSISVYLANKHIHIHDEDISMNESQLSA